MTLSSFDYAYFGFACQLHLTRSRISLAQGIRILCNNKWTIPLVHSLQSSGVVQFSPKKKIEAECDVLSETKKSITVHHRYYVMCIDRQTKLTVFTKQTISSTVKWIRSNLLTSVSFGCVSKFKCTVTSSGSAEILFTTIYNGLNGHKSFNYFELFSSCSFAAVFCVLSKP